MARAISTPTTRRMRGWIRTTCPSRFADGGIIGRRIEDSRASSPAAWRPGDVGGSSSAPPRRSRWHRVCEADVRRCSMKRALIATALLLFAGPAMAAPGDPRALRGTLEWPATLSAEPFIVVRGEDGRLYYADVSRARRMTGGAITGAVSLVAVEGNQPHELSAVVVGAGDSALSFATPPVPTPPP